MCEVQPLVRLGSEADPTGQSMAWWHIRALIVEGTHAPDDSQRQRSTGTSGNRISPMDVGRAPALKNRVIE